MSNPLRPAAVALALTPPGGDGLASRLLTYLHPIAGRPLAWHTLRALALLRPAPARLVLVAGPELPAELFRDVDAEVEVVDPADAALPERWSGWADADGTVLVADAAAVVPGERLAELAAAGGPGLLVDGPGAPVAARLGAERAAALVAAGGSMPALAEEVDPGRRLADPAALVVRDRAGLARATAAVRDRLVRGHMAAGVTFLLPDSVLVDVDVRIGRDSIVYPGVVLEGSTEVGEETVIGPSCRLVDAWIGSGVELKGWNYISHTSIRNRAILEPYVRRGFD